MADGPISSRKRGMGKSESSLPGKAGPGEHWQRKAVPKCLESCDKHPQGSNRSDLGWACRVAPCDWPWPQMSGFPGERCRGSSLFEAISGFNDKLHVLLDASRPNVLLD